VGGATMTDIDPNKIYKRGCIACGKAMKDCKCPSLDELMEQEENNPMTTLQKTLAAFDEIGFGNQARIVGTKRVELKDFIVKAIKDAVEDERRRIIDWINHQKTLACDKQQWYKISDFEYFINQPRKD